ncbi:MAG: cbb3-type cytochrome oxidase assembly protein CcoS [Rhodothermales bacterium]|nr:cbb3-type cytochrome oxidase assembly protein CcoS [Rhodothermales bacterium]
MSVLYLLVPLALLLAGAGVLAFRWAVRSGQFDDVETPALRILLDDEAPPERAPSTPKPDPTDAP